MKRKVGLVTTWQDGKEVVLKLHAHIPSLHSAYAGPEII